MEQAERDRTDEQQRQGDQDARAVVHQAALSRRSGHGQCKGPSGYSRSTSGFAREFKYRAAKVGIFDLSKEPGVGLGLVRGLIEYELGGELHLEFESQGMRCRLRIPIA